CRTICPTYFTDFNWRGIHNKDIGEIRKLAAQGFSDFFNVGKKFSFPFIVDTPFNSSLQISP
ncbi:hypothetical protein, partial [Cloacibacterium sp.]|uniref:hypothetical protein n=1 Tax=Cloacibacterium sp. TaxID=1913682 RepID=UPI0035B4997D